MRKRRFDFLARKRLSFRCGFEALEVRSLLSVSPNSRDDSDDVAALESTALPVDTANVQFSALSSGTAHAPSSPVSMEHGDDAVRVTATQVITHHDTIPRFGANPTITAIGSGSWNDPRVWSLGRAPVNGDRVTIGAGASITYGIVSDVHLSTLEISGTLAFDPTVNTRLIVGDLMVLPEGTLQVGTRTAPIAASVMAEIVIADKPLDVGTAGHPGADPLQYGTGLIAFGTVTMYGASKDKTWLRLADEPRAGDTSLLLSSAVKTWRPGETLILPDTRQIPIAGDGMLHVGAVSPAWEEIVVDRVVGNRLFLKQPLQFDHLGARNATGGLELLPHVGVLNRNVVVRSENPAGTRGHTFFGGRAEVDIEYARFQDLGRTDALQALDSSTFDASGNLTHVGTNQVGRYAVHLHHLMGAENATNSGYQFKFVGNTVDSFRKWGIALHDTSFGLIQDNVIYDGQGAGLVTEDGSEIGNDIVRNFAVRLQGTVSDGDAGTAEGDYARGGVGFWFRRSGNNVRDNVAADSSYAGIVYSGYNLYGSVLLPTGRGVDKEDPGHGILTKQNPAGVIDNNEVYGMSSFGLWAAYVTGNNLVADATKVTLSNLRIWHVFQAGVNAYHTSGLTFSGLVILGDQYAMTRNDTGAVGLQLMYYENIGLVVENSRIEGMQTGMISPFSDGTTPGHARPTIVRNSVLRNFYNIIVNPSAGDGNVLEVRNVIFGQLSKAPPRGPADPTKIRPAANIIMDYRAGDRNVVAPSIVRIYDYNGKKGDNFQVFYKEQSPDFVIPKTLDTALGGRNADPVGSPEAGLTNAQNWAKYRIAIAGGVAPMKDDTTHPEIIGYTAPIQSIPATPRVVFLTPWQGAQVTNNQPTRIRYNVDGQLPAGSKVFFNIDGTKKFAEYHDGGIFGLSEGLHTLTAYIGNATTGVQIPGTPQSTLQFAVSLKGRIYSIPSPGIFEDSAAAGISLSKASVAESAPTGQLVGKLATIGANSSNTNAYTLLDDAGGRFAIADNRLIVASSPLLSKNADRSYDIRVRSTDAEGATSDKTFTIAVTGDRLGLIWRRWSRSM